jgi:Endosomal/lysosomal potassium channel TMEM175
VIRQPLVGRRFAAKDGFRWRGHEVQRVEAFSDAVMAFAVTLLVVSLEVPRTFADLLETMNGFFAFALSFAILFRIWYLQYQFFRRYGLEDGWTIALNAALMFVVLFFVYPLKFLFSFLVKTFSGQDTRVHLPDGSLVPAIGLHDMRTLMIVYSLGYLAVFGTFWLLYRHAWSHRDLLALDRLERFDTRSTMIDIALNFGVGALSVLVALTVPDRLGGLAGLTYMLLAPVMTVFGNLRNRQRRRLETAA